MIIIIILGRYVNRSNNDSHWSRTSSVRVTQLYDSITYVARTAMMTIMYSAKMNYAFLWRAVNSVGVDVLGISLTSASGHLSTVCR